MRMQKYSLKMNWATCAFRILAGNFLDFLVHSQRIKVDKNKAKAVLEARSPRNKKELQSLIRKVNFLKRSIANSAEKMKTFSPLLRLKLAKEFVWGEKPQKAFYQMKKSLASPPVLTLVALGRHLKLYISATEDSIGSLLVQDAQDEIKRAVYYLN